MLTVRGMAREIVRMHGTLSEREKVFPGEIQRVTGYMEYCEECGNRFRRMGTGQRAICGRCYPAPPVFSDNNRIFCAAG